MTDDPPHSVSVDEEENGATPTKLEKQGSVPPTEANSRRRFSDIYASMDGDLPTNWHQVQRVWFVKLMNNSIPDAGHWPLQSFRQRVSTAHGHDTNRLFTSISEARAYEDVTSYNKGCM